AERPAAVGLLLPGDPGEWRARRLPAPVAQPAGPDRPRRQVPAGKLPGAAGGARRSGLEPSASPVRHGPAGSCARDRRKVHPARRVQGRATAKKSTRPGETADSALMFLPSEAVYAELHANFPALVEETFRSRVWIVSPTTLMATLTTVRAVLKDVHLREQAHII